MTAVVTKSDQLHINLAPLETNRKPINLFLCFSDCQILGELWSGWLSYHRAYKHVPALAGLCTIEATWLISSPLILCKQVRMLNTGFGHTGPWFCFVGQAEQHRNLVHIAHAPLL